MIISLQYTPLINAFLVALLLLYLLLGYNQGFLVQLINLLGFVTALFIAWLLAPAFSRLFPLLPANFSPFGDTILKEFFYGKINGVVWFIIILIVMLVLIHLLKLVVKQLSKVPVISFVNKMLGVGLGLLRYSIIVLLIIFLISSPLVKNGQAIIEATWLQPIQKVSEPVFNLIGESVADLAILQDFINDPKQLSAEQLESFVNWLSKNGINEKQILDFLDYISHNHE